MPVKTTVVGLDEVRKLLKDMPGDFFDKTKKEIAKTLFKSQANIVTPMKTGANNLQSRTGNLAKSIKFNLQGTSIATLQGNLFTKSVYAPVHEHGAMGDNKIVAKKAYMKLPGGPFLNIPSSKNKTKSGITKLSPKQVFDAGGYIVPINAPKAQYMVALNGEPMYWLVKSVEFEGNLKMVESTEKEVPTLLSNLNKILLEGL